MTKETSAGPATVFVCSGAVDDNMLLDAQLRHLGLSRRTALISDASITALVADRPRFARWRTSAEPHTVVVPHSTLPTGFAFDPALEAAPSPSALDELTATLAPFGTVVRVEQHQYPS